MSNRIAYIFCRNLKLFSKHNNPGTNPSKQSQNFKDSEKSRHRNFQASSKDTKNKRTIMQYLFSKIG